MTQLQQKLALPAAMAQKLDGLRQRTLKVRIGTALVTALGVLLAAMAIAMLIDWLATIFDTRWRAVLTYSAWSLAGVTFLAWAVAAYRHTRQLAQVAAEIDREIPELEERWSTVTTVTTNGHSADVHPAMFKQVSAEAQQWVPRIDADRVVPIDGLIRALLALTAITAILGFAVLFDAQRTTVLLRRFWQPHAPISATQLIDVTGKQVVGRGESIKIAASLMGIPVKKASLLLEPEQGDLQTISLAPRNDNQNQLTYRLRSVKQPLRYRFRAGDGQSPWYEIIVADRPQIANVIMTLTPPAYTRKAPKVINKLPRRLTVLEGSHLEIAFKPKQPVQSLELKLSDDHRQQLTPDHQGWYRWQTTLSKNISFQPLLTEQHGLTNLRPPLCEIRCRPDKPPVVKILTPTNQMAVRPNETIPVTFIASDDVGIQQAELIVYDENNRIDGKPVVLDRIPVPLGDQQGAIKVKVTVDLDLSKYKTTDGAELSFSIRVREDRGQQTLANSPAIPTTAQPPQQANQQSPGSALLRENLAKEMSKSLAKDVAKEIKANQVGQQNQPAANAAPTTPTADQNQTASAQKAPPTAKQAQSPSPSPSLSPNPSTAQTTQPKKPNSSSATTQSKPTAKSSAKSPNEQQIEPQEPASKSAATPPKEQPLENKKPSATAPNAPNKNNPPPPTNQRSGQPQKNSTQNQQGSKKSQPTDPQNSKTPGNPMARRKLDVKQQAQSSSSKRMKIKVDEWVGSYDSQQRQKLELAVAPRLAELDQALEKAQLLSRSVLDQIDSNANTNDSQQWTSQHDRDLQRADEQIETVLKIVEDLEKKTYGTSYAFIGLQLVDIGQAHVGPARRDFWKAMQLDSKARIDSLRNGWQHTTRARELLKLLTERFQRTQAEYKMAEAVERIKKMYQIYIEDSMALLRPGGGEGSRYGRKMAEFDLDEEYLERLKEVMEIRNAMRAELARILAEDPRLLRRYLDAQRNRSVVLRNELDRLIERQTNLNRETRAWAAAEDDKRSDLAAILLGRHVESAQDLAITAAELHDRFETWSPLGQEVKDAEFKATAEVLQEIATATQELSADGSQYVIQSLRTKKKTGATEDPFDAEAAVDQIAADAQQLYQRFTRLEILLRQIGSRQERLEISSFAINRLLETRRLIEQTSAWIRQLKQQRAGNYHRSAEVAQYRLAMQTDSMAGKLADLEQRMAGLFQRQDGMLPQALAEKARSLLAALDEQASPNQLAAVYSLRRNQMPRATSRQASALEALELVGKLYDEMIEASIKELDKLPVQDPIASLLDDPTLDELLRALEQEIPIQEALGIPRRPSNLRIMTDWLRSGGDNSLMTGGNSRMLLNQMRQQQQLRQRQLDKAYRRAVARALKEADAADLVKDMPKLARENTDWNRLASQLSDDLQQGRDKAPPERYRRAIEQYFRQLSRAEKDSK